MINIFSKNKYSTKFRKYYRSKEIGRNVRGVLSEERYIKSIHKQQKYSKLHSINADEATLKICAIMGI